MRHCLVKDAILALFTILMHGPGRLGHLGRLWQAWSLCLHQRGHLGFWVFGFGALGFGAWARQF